MRTVFAAVASILSPEGLMAEVLPGFDIGEAAECRFYSFGFNHTYRVKTKGGRTYYLRVYRTPWRTLEDIRYELDLLIHLKRKGFPAAQPVSHADGQYFVPVLAPEGQRYVALFTEAEGRELSFDDEPEKVSRSYGRAVATMHDALADFSCRHRRFRMDLPHFIDKPLRSIEPFLADRPQDWAYVQRFSEVLRQRLTALPAGELEQGACHGDIQGGHAKVAADGTMTFFDFDCGGYGYRAYDLAVFLWSCRLQDAVAVRWRAFLDGYRNTRSISDLDIQAVPLFVCARCLWHIGIRTENAPDWGMDCFDGGYFDSHLARLRVAEADCLRQESP